MQKNTRVVNIKLKQGHDGGIPDPNVLAKKYEIDVEYNESDEEEELLEKSKESNYAPDVTKAIDFEGAKHTELLITKLDEKNKEIEKLCVLLEAVEPIPGILVKF